MCHQTSMMFTIIYLTQIMWKYELKKIFCFKPHIILFIGLLSLTSILFFYESKQDDISYEDYKNIQIQLNQRNETERISYLNEKQDEITLYMQKNNTHMDLSYYLDTYGKSWIDSVFMKDVQEIAHMELIKRVMAEEKNLTSYQNFMESIHHQYYQNNEISIFKNDDPFTLERSKKTMSLYEGMMVEMPSSANGVYGIEKALNSFFTDIFMGILLLYFFSYIFVKEIKTNFLEYCSILKKGHWRLVISKWLALIFTSFALQFFMMCALIITSFNLYGPVNLFDPIQSVLGFVSVPNNINIITFLFFVCLCKTFVFSFCITFFLWIYSLIKNFVYSIFIQYGILVMLAILSSRVGQNTLLSYCSFNKMLHPEVYMKNAEYISIFQQAIPYSLFYGLLLFITIVCLILSCFFFYRMKKPNKKVKTKRQSHTLHSLIYYEAKKLYFIDKGIVFFVLFIVVQVLLVGNIKSVSTMADIQVNTYIDTIGNSVTQDVDDKIINEKLRFEEIDRQLEEETNPAILQELYQQQRLKQGFDEYSRRYEVLKTTYPERILLKEDQTRFLFQNEQGLSEILFYFIVTMCLFCMIAYKREYESNVYLIQKTSPNAGRVEKQKWLLIGSGCACLVIFMNVILFIKNVLMYPNANYMNIFNHLTEYIPSGLSLPLSVIFGFQILWQIVVTFLFAYLCLWTFKTMKNRNIFLILWILFFAVPLLFSETVFKSFTLIYPLYYPWKNLTLSFSIFFISAFIACFLFFIDRREK